ncbi:MAG: Dabb family protein [Treponemataceae bacterium]|nr:Dabb family protein [Treponemataceae bacterium]
MVKHIILWKIKEEYNDKKDQIKKGVKDSLEGLAGKIPGLLTIKVQTKCLESSTSDLMLYTEFKDQESLKNYSVHPDHVKAADTYVRPFMAQRSCLDFLEK